MLKLVFDTPLTFLPYLVCVPILILLAVLERSGIQKFIRNLLNIPESGRNVEIIGDHNNVTIINNFIKPEDE